MKVSPGAWLGASDGREYSRPKFLHLHCLWVQQVQIFWLQLVGIECPYHLLLSPPLKLHSYNSKSRLSFVGPCHLPQFWGKNSKATTKMNLTSHQQCFLDRSLAKIMDQEISYVLNIAYLPVLVLNSYSSLSSKLTTTVQLCDWTLRVSSLLLIEFESQRALH